MSAPGNIPVTSINALASTIQNDGQVSRWFEFLITRPELRTRLSTDTVLADCYKSLDNLRTVEKILIGLLVCLIPIAILWQPIPMLALGLLLFWRYVHTGTHKAQLISQISLVLVSQDFPSDRLLVTSLYQLGEFYSERYRIPSLVDTIFYLDKITRWVIFSVFLVTYYVIPLSVLWPPVCVIISMFLITSLTKSDLIYKKIP